MFAVAILITVTITTSCSRIQPVFLHVPYNPASGRGYQHGGRPLLSKRTTEPCWHSLCSFFGVTLHALCEIKIFASMSSPLRLKLYRPHIN